MAKTQQGDVFLFQTNDEGEIEVENGLVTMIGDFRTAFYLSLFGGNEDDSGVDTEDKTFWGNVTETVAARKYISRVQNLLKSLPATSGNLIKVENAAVQDLEWFLTEKIGNKLTVSASLIGLNSVKFSFNIFALGKESEFNFIENWKAAP